MQTLEVGYLQDLNLGWPRTNPAGGQSKTRTSAHKITSPMLWPLGHIAFHGH